MMTRPGGWKDVGPRCTVAAPGQEESAPVSVQRCLSVDGARGPGSERRCAARTQLGMPALLPPPSEPSATSRRSSSGNETGSPLLAAAQPRRAPPPLPARFATPKVVVAAAPPLRDTVPARRLLLQDATCELDEADLLPLRQRPRPAPARGAASAARHVTQRPRGMRGLLTGLLVRLLSLVAPSLQVQPSRRQDDGRRSPSR
jgi:hypothetical protein